MVKKVVSVLGDSTNGAECKQGLLVKTIGVTTVFAGGLPVQAGDLLHLLQSSRNTSHVYDDFCTKSHSPTLIGTSLTVTVEGMSIGRTGDGYSECTATIVTGLQSTVFAGG
jgi:uncharacterized Zn-binding protein involved in type VI secretion